MSIVVEPFVRHLTQTHARAPQPLARNGRHLDRQLRAGAERTLWNHLRDGRLGGARFRRQYLVDIYLADFICPAAKLVIELESTLTPALALHANARRAFFHAQGYQVLRMRDRDVLIETRAVLDTIRQALTFGSRDAGR
jgi:very-short-patch-repair endonuclease